MAFLFSLLSSKGTQSTFRNIHLKSKIKVIFLLSHFKVSAMSTPVDSEVEFRSYVDDAWYSVQLLLDREGEKLTVKFSSLPGCYDEVFDASGFHSLETLEEFENRFRPVSIQLQDTDCSKVVKGLRVCASHAFNDNDIRFFDAILEDVIKSEHSFASGEEECLCSFILCWKHGPNADTYMEKKVENICMVQSNLKLNPHVASFAKRAKEKIEGEGANLKYISASNGDSANCKSSAGCRENSNPIVKQVKCAKRSTSSIWSCEGKTSDLQDIDIEIGRDGYHYIILLENLEKELSPSTVIEFIHQHTRITPQAYIFPSLPWELSTQGAVMLDSRKNLEVLSDFLSNADHFVVSSKGRPWVVNKNLMRHDACRASIGTFMLSHQKKLQKNNAGIRHELKVVCSGTEEYRRAKELRDLFMEFSCHQERLFKRLALEERKILHPSTTL